MTEEAFSESLKLIIYPKPKILGILKNPLQIVFCSFLAACAQVASGTAVKETRKLLEEWVGVEKLISEEKSKWQTEKATLQDLVVALRVEISQLDKNLEKSDAEATGASLARSKLMKRSAVAENAAKKLNIDLNALEREILLAMDSFPSPLVRRLRSFREKLTDREQRKSLTLRERLEACLAILQSAQIFHGGVNLERQEFSLNEEQSREFHVLYFGMSIAYFVNESGTVAGYGTPGPRGWLWERRDNLADEIRKGVSIRKKRALPSFLELPIPRKSDANENEDGIK